jgi:hypothetical protein
MKCSRFFLTLSLFVALFQLHGQAPSIDDNKAHRRYWYYRTRLINDFMKIGKDQGDCVVFPERNYSGTNNRESKVGPDQIDIVNQYLMTLALEYKLLTRNSQNPEETVKEIYNILYSINRLDMEAEQFWDSNFTPPSNQHVLANGPLNGFILREDMPSDYLTKNKNRDHFNYSRLEVNNTNPPTGFCGLEYTDTLTSDNKFSNYTGFPPGSNNQPKNDLSWVQDKYHSLLVSLMFIVKYIPSGTTHKENNVVQSFQDGEIYIRNEAIKMANRVYLYCRGPFSTWVLTYLNSANQSQGTLGVGAFANIYSWALSRMTCHTTFGFPFPPSNSPCVAYTDPTSVGIGFPAYQAQFTSPGFSMDNAVFKAWDEAGVNDPAVLLPDYLAMVPNTTAWNIEWAQLLRKVLHQNGLLVEPESTFASSIDQAPCSGPYNFGSCNLGGCEWSAQDRLEHGNSRGAGCTACGNSNNPFPGNYPGVDYMLLHNLYYEHLNQQKDLTASLPVYAGYNLMDNDDQSFWPVTLGSITLGTNAFPAKVAVFQNLVSTAHIFATNSPFAPGNSIPSNVAYRAGKSIELLPSKIPGAHGFTVENGSEFTATVQRYVCSGNNDALYLRYATDSSLTSNDYENDEITQIPLHYVESPPSDADNNPYGTQGASYSTLESTAQLQQQLIDAKIEKKETEIYNQNLNTRFSVMPNPSDGLFKIYVNKLSDNEQLSLQITDMKGNEVIKHSDIDGSLEIDMRACAEGLYMVRLISNQGFNHFEKISIAK